MNQKEAEFLQNSEIYKNSWQIFITTDTLDLLTPLFRSVKQVLFYIW